MAKWLCYGKMALFTHLLHCPVEVVNAALAAVESSTVAPQPTPARMEESFSMAPPLSTSSTMAGPTAIVASATPGLAATSGASSLDTPTEE
ncbi:hypothetical protein E4T56_gene10964 [Termitomyces sp. T112]|nr:hypothetical protein E4T56_gene10964 [Termitomyces sp. T112]